jgi:predicted dehydrogenase
MTDRRGFLRTAAASALAGLALPASGAHAAWGRDPKPRRVGLIGSGWYGKADLLRLIQVAPVEVVSLCDVDAPMLASAAELVASRQASRKTPRTYHDYREMLAEKDLDLCLIATPDHWHALTAIAAMEAGADLYLQKPISADVREGQAILATARRLDRVVQIGTQRRSTPHLIEAKRDIIDAGRLGQIGLVEMYCYYHMRGRGNPPDTAPPEGLDWEFWTGPAPLRPYHEGIHPRGWRSYKEYGNGIVGDMCVHMLDTARWMLNLGWPVRISSGGGILVDRQSRANVPDTQTAVFDFGDLTAVWEHRTWGSTPDPKYPWGLTIYGDKGTLKASVMSYDFLPNGKGEEPVHRDVAYELDEYPEDRTEKDLEKHVAPAIRLHMKNLLQCIDDRSRPVADVEQGYISTASCILANQALELGRTLVWDANKGQVIGDDEANGRLARPYRSPWVHPSV